MRLILAGPRGRADGCPWSLPSCPRLSPGPGTGPLNRSLVLVGDLDPLVGSVDGHGATARNDVLRFGVAEVDPEDHRHVGVILGYGRQHRVALLLGIAGFSRLVVALAVARPRFGATPDDASEALEQLAFAHAHQDPVDVVG